MKNFLNLKIVYQVTASYLTSSIIANTVVIKTFTNERDAQKLAEKLEEKAERENEFCWYDVRKKIIKGKKN